MISFISRGEKEERDYPRFLIFYILSPWIQERNVELGLINLFFPPLVQKRFEPRWKMMLRHFWSTLPDRLFNNNFRASKSGDKQALCSLEASIDGF